LASPRIERIDRHRVRIWKSGGDSEIMKKNEVRFRIEEIGIIPAVRLSSADDALFAVEAVASGGIPIVEVTMTVPGALEVIENLAHNGLGVIVGAGTVLDIEAARRCLGAGAMFLTSTGLDLEMVDFAVKQEVVVFPGVLTPTEVMMASKAGVDFVKIFPCSQLGGPAYIKALKAPFPQVPLIASGGVNQRTAADFIVAGAVAVGIGGDLIQPDAIKCRERDWIR
jgi:2-dehydro-3-deoxyphosphogluconate aldolase/(4S)-4-hydroxy-2-oxoglutarate aldolase